MHAQGVRRVMGRRWIWLQRGAMVALAIQAAFFLCGAPTARADTRVDYLQVERETSFASSRVYAGTAVAARASELGFKQGGEIASVAVDIGDRVAKGDVLAMLDSRALEAAVRQAEADVRFASASLAAQQAETELAAETELRFRRLKTKGHVSAQEYSETRLALVASQAQVRVARAAYQRAVAAKNATDIRLQETQVIAPFAGVVQLRRRDEGSQVAPGENVLRLVADDVIEAHIGVPATVAVTMNPGDVHQVRWNNNSYAARLRAIPPEIDSPTRTLTAVLTMSEAAIPLGAVVELTLAQQVDSAGFWLPVSALTESDRGLWGVYVVNADSVVERHLVEVVHTESDRAFVRGTLTSADKVIRTGVQRIVPGQRVELALN